MVPAVSSATGKTCVFSSVTIFLFIFPVCFFLWQKTLIGLLFILLTSSIVYLFVFQEL